MAIKIVNREKLSESVLMKVQNSQDSLGPVSGCGTLFSDAALLAFLCEIVNVAQISQNKRGPPCARLVGMW